MKTVLSISSVLLLSSALSVAATDLAWGNKTSASPLIAQADSEIAAQPMTIDDVQAIADEIDEALSQGDVEGILEYFAPFIISETITETDTGIESVILEGLDQHQEMLENSLGNRASTEAGPELEVIDERETIRITPDGQLATIVASNTSQVTTEEGITVFTTTDTVRLARIEGKIKIISFTNDSRVTAHSDQE